MKKPAKKTYRIRNWKEYTKGLVNRGRLTIWISEDVADGWYNQEPTGKRGASDTYSAMAITCVLTLQEVYHQRLRQAQGLTQSIVELMGLELDVPNYTTLSRRRTRLNVSLGATARDAAIDMVVDATGVKLYGEGEWKVRQHGASKRRTWRKVHLGIDPDTHQIIAAVVTGNDVGDGEVLEDLLEQVDGEIASVTGDGAYDTRNCYEAINDKRARAIIPPRRGAKIWRHGNAKAERHARDENLRDVRKKGRAAWKRDSGYHTRSLAETGMFRFKTIFGVTLGARLFESQAAEVFIKCAALNTMARLGLPDSYVVG
jgi:DDE family transposase